MGCAPLAVFTHPPSKHLAVVPVLAVTSPEPFISQLELGPLSLPVPTWVTSFISHFWNHQSGVILYFKKAVCCTNIRRQHKALSTNYSEGHYNKRCKQLTYPSPRAHTVLRPSDTFRDSTLCYIFVTITTNIFKTVWK